MPRRNYPKNRSIAPSSPSVSRRHELPDSTCRSKQRFSSEKVAKRQAETRMLGDFQLELTVYKCDNCRGWHLTRRDK